MGLTSLKGVSLIWNPSHKSGLRLTNVEWVAQMWNGCHHQSFPSEGGGGGCGGDPPPSGDAELLSKTLVTILGWTQTATRLSLCGCSKAARGHRATYTAPYQGPKSRCNQRFTLRVQAIRLVMPDAKSWRRR